MDREFGEIYIFVFRGRNCLEVMLDSRQKVWEMARMERGEW
jgi:hypothetical protein